MRRQLSFHLKKHSIQTWKQTSKIEKMDDTKKMVVSNDLAKLHINDDHHHHNEQPLQEISFDDTKSTLSSNSISSTLSLHRSDDDHDNNNDGRKNINKKKSNGSSDLAGDNILVVEGNDYHHYHRERGTSINTTTTTTTNQHSSRRKLIQNLLTKHNQNHTTFNKRSLLSLQNKMSTPNDHKPNPNDNTTNDMNRKILHRSFSSFELLQQRRNTSTTFQTKANCRSQSSSVRRDLSKTLHDRASSSFHKMMTSKNTSSSQRQSSSPTSQQQEQHEQDEQHGPHHHDFLPKKEQPQRQHTTKLKRTKKSQSFVYRSCPNTMIVIIATTLALMAITKERTTMVSAHGTYTEYNMSPLRRRDGSSPNYNTGTLDFVNPFATDSMYSPMLDNLRHHGKKGTKQQQHSDQKMLSNYGYQHTWISNEHGFLLPIPTKGKRKHPSSSSLKTKEKKKGSSRESSNANDTSFEEITTTTIENNSSSYLMTFMEIKSLEKCAQKCSTIDAISGGFHSNKQTCYCHRRKRRQSHAESDSGEKTTTSKDYQYCRELPAAVQTSLQHVQVFTSLSNKPPKCPKSVCLHYYSEEYCQQSKRNDVIPPPGILVLPPIPFEASDSDSQEDYYFDFSTKYWYYQNSAVLQDSRGSDGSGGRNGAVALSTTTSSATTQRTIIQPTTTFAIIVLSFAVVVGILWL